MRLLADFVNYVDDAADRYRTAHEDNDKSDKDDLEPRTGRLRGSGWERDELGRRRLCDRLKCLRRRGTRLLLCAGSARAAKSKAILQWRSTFSAKLAHCFSPDCEWVYSLACVDW
jgi:hypothetical protein